VKNKRAFVGFLLVLITIAATLAACNMPTRRNQPRSTTEAVYTQSAATIIAQLTGIAQGDFPPSETVGVLTDGTSTPEATPDNTNTPAPPTQVITPTVAATAPVVSATITATLTTVPASEDPRLTLGEPDWIDNFENDFYWPTYEDENVRFWLRENSMLMRAKGSENRDSWMLAGEKPQDYYLEMTAQPQSCAGLDRYGFIVRSDAETGYLFGFSCDGQYSVRKWDGDTFTTLIDWTTNPSIQLGAGQDNRLGVMAEGNRYRFYANGALLDEVTDESYSGGRFGLFVAGKEIEDFTARVKEVAYWELPE